MALLYSRLCILVFVACLSLANKICFAHLHHNNKHVALFVFGDSLFDPGNNNYINTTTDFQADFPPYGKTFFRHATGRFSDGRLIPDFIAEYAKLPMIPSFFQTGNGQFVYGVNFASGGAGALVGTYSGMVIDLKTQLRYFKDVVKHLKLKLGRKEAQRLLSNSVYLFSIGNNDYLSRPQIFSSSPEQEDYVGMVIGNTTATIKAIYKKGGRKFGFVGLGPLGCIPSERAQNLKEGGGCTKSLTTLVKMHNLAFSKNIKKLEKKLKGLKYSIFDFFDAAKEIIDNPSKYDFKEVKTACCGSGPYRGVYSCGGKRQVKEYELCDNPAEYLFFDSVHPNERAYKHFAELMWNGTPDIVGPYNLKSLF